MQIIIPMSGLGSRFIAAGYKEPKPLIKVQGRPIIEWVLKMFPKETDITFICRDEHLEKTNMRETLEKLAPTANIISIKGHRKGPVYAVAQVAETIDDNRPALISYCDYYMHWDYEDFKTKATNRQCAGAIPCYTGFHPNLIPEKNLYASCNIDKNDNLIEIKEKFSFTKDKTQSLHSPGVYYFQTGAIVKKYFQMIMDEDINLGGEYYASLVYNLMVRDGLDVWVPANVPHFCQWGTPEDLKEYLFWTNTLKGNKQCL